MLLAIGLPHEIAHGSLRLTLSAENTREELDRTVEALDGLPPVKVHCSLLAEEAIHAALWDCAKKQRITIEGLKEPASTDQ